VLVKTEIFCLNISNNIAFKAKLNHVLMGSVVWREINVLYRSFSTSYYFSDTLRSVLGWYKRIFPRLHLNCRERVTWAAKAAVPVQQRANRGFTNFLRSVSSSDLWI